jgi:hypothetical protein
MTLFEWIFWPLWFVALYFSADPDWYWVYQDWLIEKMEEI